jgi:hypothetical protein
MRIADTTVEIRPIWDVSNLFGAPGKKFCVPVYRDKEVGVHGLVVKQTKDKNVDKADQLYERAGMFSMSDEEWLHWQEYFAMDGSLIRQVGSLNLNASEMGLTEEELQKSLEDETDLSVRLG